MRNIDIDSPVYEENVRRTATKYSCARATIHRTMSLQPFPPFPMSRPTLLAAGIAATILLVPMISVAASLAQEPSNGFVRGPRPSWSLTHAKSGTDAHRAFHADVTATLASMKKNGASAEEMREALQKIEREHRVFHGWNSLPQHQSVVSTPATSTPKATLNPLGSSAEWMNGFQPIYTELRYEGSRPSIRLLQEYARLRGVR